MSIGIAGAGRLAQALGRRLREAGQPVTSVASRDCEHARIAAAFIGGECQPVCFANFRCERVLIAVADRAIVEVAGSFPPPRVLLHTCGAHGAALLNKQHDAGVSVGSLHPLQTFATPEAGYRVLPGSAFAIDGDPEAVAWAEEIVGDLHGTILRIPGESRAIYHAAAAMASNHLTALLDAASQLLKHAGVPQANILEALAPISRAALENALSQEPLQALTGPVERGDIETVTRHLQAIRPASRPIQELYRAASLQALDMAVRRGMPPETARALTRQLQA